MPKGGKVAFGTEINVFIGKNVTSEDAFMTASMKEKDYEGITNYLMDRIRAAKS